MVLTKSYEYESDLRSNEHYSSISPYLWGEIHNRTSRCIFFLASSPIYSGFLSVESKKFQIKSRNETESKITERTWTITLKNNKTIKTQKKLISTRYQLTRPSSSKPRVSDDVQHG